MTENEITMKLRELKQLSALLEETEQEMEAIRDSIKTEMNALDIDELRAGEFKVTWKAVTSARVDTKALQNALPDIAKQFMKTTTSRRFCVS